MLSTLKCTADITTTSMATAVSNPSCATRRVRPGQPLTHRAAHVLMPTGPLCFFLTGAEHVYTVTHRGVKEEVKPRLAPWRVENFTEEDINKVE